MYNNVLKFSVFLVFLQSIHCCGDHYWRDYEGVIPDDAIPAGKNSKGISYLGQVHMHTYGLMMGTIIPGKYEVEVPCYGARKSDVMIKILCAKDKSKYKWIPTSSSNYKADTFGKCPVIGGYDQRGANNINVPLGTLLIGRTRQHGDVIAGNVGLFYDKNKPWLFYPFNDKEHTLHEFDILVYTGDD